MYNRLENRIAQKIREIRKSKGLTLAQLAEKVRLSKALLSRIENNRTSPPIATLSRISEGLGVPISIFFQGEGNEDEGRYAVTRKAQRRQVVSRGTRIGFTYYSLTGMKVPHVMEPFIVHYPVTKKDRKILFDHPGEEFLLVLKGEIELIYGKDKIRLKEGDAIHFDPSVPHRGRNIGPEGSECLVIVVDRTVVGAVS